MINYLLEINWFPKKLYELELATGFNVQICITAQIRLDKILKNI